jgi:flagellar basal-body rod modification protein FlgD
MTPIAQVAADPPAAQQSSGDNSASSAFGLSFEALLKIILTQLTYQDPLKPMDNFEFVSQLGQFSQIQQGQTTNDHLSTLVSAQGTSQATSLLGTKVDVPAGAATLSGTVTAITFENGTPRVTIETSDGRTIAGLSISSISQVRKED